MILGFIEGHTVAELTEIANEVYEESIAERVWPGTRRLLRCISTSGSKSGW